ncbi:diguanylate cyclase domain-containing protein [Allochromatium palmeri]|uniref:Diguanylate cyclase n=1 Tax=Allochromatium palmeri TaxID=231048 RepID=A0A6N8EBL1_9GAMM|nr:GGDEF domain-containing protein [Allochromatium palmeri]MTW19927.1 diguanylate cyclase [Allochromatium palmeri]
MFESMPLHTFFILPENQSKPTGFPKRMPRMQPTVRMAAPTTGSRTESASDRPRLETAVAVHCHERTPFALLRLRCVITDDDSTRPPEPSWPQVLTARLKDGIRRYDTVLWEGGECFAVILKTVDASHTASLIADRIRHRLNPPLLVEGHSVKLDVRIGQAVYPQDGREARLLIQKAECALSEPTSTVSAVVSSADVQKTAYS